MSRPLVAAALAALAVSIAGAAHAQSPPALYGLLDAAASRVKPAGGESRWQLDSGSMSRSFIGLRGSDDLGGGLRSVYRLESYIRVDTGSAARNDADAFWSREASVGLSGQFGTTVLGRNVSPLYLATINYNPFGESFAFSPSTRQWFAGAVVGDRSWNNSLAYVNSASDSPLRIRFAANLLESTPGSGRNVGASVAYTRGPLSVVLAAERIKNSPLALPVGFQSQKAILLGATYDFKIIRVYGQLGRVSTNADSDGHTTLAQIGAAVPLGSGVILVAYGRSRAYTPVSRITDQTTSIGYDYFLSKSTDIYIAGLYEKVFELSPGRAVAGGLRLRF